MKALRVPIELPLGYWHVSAPDLAALPRDCTAHSWSLPGLDGREIGRDFGEDSNVCEGGDSEDSNYMDSSYGWSATHF